MSESKNTLERSLVVDSIGSLITDGSQYERFKAFPTVPVRFGVQKGEIEGFYRTTEPHHDSVLGRALFYVSQFPEGRNLLRLVQNNDVHFRQNLKGESAGQEVFASFREENNTVTIFQETKDPVYLSFAIIEELTHARDVFSSNLSSDASHTLRSQIILERAFEASAKAAKTRFAFTCDLEAKRHPDYFCPPLILEHLKEELPVSYEAGLKALPLLEKGDKYAFTREIFTSFHKDSDQVSLYDLSLLETYAGAIQNRRKRFSDILHNPPYGSLMMTDDVNHRRLTQGLKLDGVPYLAEAKFCLDDPEFTTLSSNPEVTSAHAKLAKLVETDPIYRFLNATVGKLTGRDFRPSTDTNLIVGAIGARPSAANKSLDAQ